MNSIGERIKSIRGEISQSQFSASLDIGQTKLSRLERGTTEPETSFYEAISIAYGVSLDWLITGYGPKLRSSAQPSESDDVTRLKERIAALEVLVESRKETIAALKGQIELLRECRGGQDISTGASSYVQSAPLNVQSSDE